MEKLHQVIPTDDLLEDPALVTDADLRRELLGHVGRDSLVPYTNELISTLVTLKDLGVAGVKLGKAVREVHSDGLTVKRRAKTAIG
jgi:hypothetical protein